MFIIIITVIKNPQDKWWNQEQYLSDIGLPGFLYTLMINPSKSETVTSINNNHNLVPGIHVKELISKLSDQRDQSHAIESSVELNKPNIIIYQLESISSWVQKADPDPLPFLMDKREGNIFVDEFYANSCDTLNAELSTLCSALPDAHHPVNYAHKDNQFYCLPEYLSDEQEYRTALFHAGDAEFYDRDVLSKSWGFKELYFNEVYGHKSPDDLVIKDIVKKINDSNQPFFAYLIGFTGHSPHNKEQLDYYRDAFNVDINSYEGNIPENISQSIMETDEQTIRDYLGFVQYVNKSLETLFTLLEENELVDNTIVVIHGDHRYYNFSSDNDKENFLNYNLLPFLIHVPGEIKQDLPNIGSHIDIAPTILDIMKLESPASFVGESMLSSQHPENAVSKCLSQVNYVDENTIASGNVRTNVYRYFPRDDSMDKNKQQQYTAQLRELIEVSDKYINEDRLTEGL